MCCNYITTTETTSTTTSSSTTATTTACSALPSIAALFIENSVILDDQWLPRKAPIGTGGNSTNGVWNYFNGTTSSNFDVTERVWAGYWERGNCESPCLCSNSSCYVLQPGNYSTEPPAGYRSINPIINLYPHCNDPCTVPRQCFIAVVVQQFRGDSYTRIPGFLVNPLNPADNYDLGVLFRPGYTLDINDQVFAKITKIGCSGCPVVT